MKLFSLFILVSILVFCACDDGDLTGCTEGAFRCNGTTVEVCNVNNQWVETQWCDITNLSCQTVMLADGEGVYEFAFCTQTD